MSVPDAFDVLITRLEMSAKRQRDALEKTEQQLIAAREMRAQRQQRLPGT